MITFREATENDYSEIVNIPRSENELLYAFCSAKYPLTVQQFVEQTKDRLHKTVGIINGKTAAFADMYNIVNDDSVFIGNILVNVEHRGSGIAGKLLDYMADQSKLYGAKSIKLNCWSENVRGLLFYTKCGYKPSVIKKSENNGRIIAVIEMIKSLD